MALILKPGKTYTDRYGHTGSDFYSRIGRISDVNKSRQEVLFSVEIYLNKYASDRGLYPVDIISFVMKDKDFVNWYVKPLVENNGIDPYKQLYLCLESIADEKGKLVWENWQSDEM